MPLAELSDISLGIQARTTLYCRIPLTAILTGVRSLHVTVALGMEKKLALELVFNFTIHL